MTSLIALHAPAGVLDQRQGALFGARHDGVEREVRVGELLVGQRRNAALPLLRNGVVAEHHAQDAAGAGGVAVGILAGARRDLQRLAEIAPAVEQAQRDVGAVQLGVDVERLEGAARAGVAFVPLLLKQVPHLLPVLRILLVPGEQVGDQDGVGALGRNAGERRPPPPCADRFRRRPPSTCTETNMPP